jgi:hypothetical protein
VEFALTLGNVGLSLAGIIATALAITAWISVFQNGDLSRAARGMWVVVIALLPIVGSAVYFSVRSDW